MTRLVLGYVEGAWGNWLAARGARLGQEMRVPVEQQPRVWVNGELRSRNYLVPGLVAIIMTLIGALLTALVMAREWERGTMEALLVTPASMTEVRLGKLGAYFVLGTGGMLLTVGLAVWLFEVPLRGSFWVLWACSSLFLLAAVGIGLLVSSVVATMQQAMLFSFMLLMPFTLLSGLTTPISCMPTALRQLTCLNPLRHDWSSTCVWQACARSGGEAAQHAGILSTSCLWKTWKACWKG